MLPGVKPWGRGGCSSVMRFASWQVVSKVFIADNGSCMMLLLLKKKLPKVIIQGNYQR